MTILWLSGKTISPGIKAVLASTLQRAGVKSGSVMFNSLYYKTPLLSEVDVKKMPDKIVVGAALKNLRADIAILKPKVIVINDEMTLRIITGEKYTLATCRGSLYYFDGIPCIVIDIFATIRYKKYGKFVFELDLAKIARWAKGEQKNEAAFSYVLCKTIADVIEQTTAAASSVMVATDRETASGFITCTAYTYTEKNGKLISFTVPFYDPTTETGAYWKTEKEEIEVHNLLRKLNVSKVIKVFQNGTYDCAYDILYGMESANYLVDTQNLMHSIWCEVPKRLHNIASYFCDNYTYWKDENKGEKEDAFGRGSDGLERYWRYNALDSYYTFLAATELLARIVQLPWALRNYNSEFSLSVGPCLAASLRGIKVDTARHAQIMNNQFQLFEAGKADIKRLSGEEDFNINSPSDVAWLLYDVLGAKATRLQRKRTKLGPRSTDEKVLKLMKEQRNFFVSHAIDRILKAKKPGAVLSKYGNIRELCYKNNRFLSWHNAAGTETFRLNSGSSQFWTGTNAQNLQPFIQEFFVADLDYVFVDCDYSASDDWFIAHEAQDEDKIAILKSGKDVHSYHASVFFRRLYEDIIAGKKKHEDWVVHAITGLRQISKKIAHGKNFRMQATMMYNLMGRDIAVAMAKAMGYVNAEGLTDKELIAICNTLCDLYDHPKRGMYKRIRAWQDETVQELKDNGGLATNAFGITRAFLGDPDDHATQRELSAFFGQSGTSGSANRSINEIFYSGIDDGRRCLFLVQVHDSLKFLVHRSNLSCIPRIKEIMERSITLKGRTFFVPVNIEVGLTDGKQMLPWHPGITYEEIRAHEEKTYSKKFPKGSQALLDQLGALNFGGEALASLDQELALRFGGQDHLGEPNEEAEILEEMEE